MSVAPRIGLQQRQKLTLSPAMRSALSLLRMPADQLHEEIAREASENPFLQVRQRASGGAYDVALATVAGHDSLSVSLAQQIRLQRLDAETRATALFLVTQLREDGFLDATLAELSADHGVAVAVLERGLAVLQRCEPTGIGARNLAECLELQLIEKGYGPPLAGTIVRHLEDFAAGRTARLARVLSMTPDQIARIARDIRNLAASAAPQENLPVVPRIAELLVERRPHGGLVVALNPEAAPQVTLADLQTVRGDSADLGPYFDRARNILRSLQARSTTLLRIGRHILDSQSAFFEGHPATVRPESRAEAAAQLGMHASTFGRALAGKALAIDGKVYALAQFFSRGLPHADGTISAHDIRARIRTLILAEDRTSPLADEAICTHFKNEGVDIARRTVAKYRKCMRIPTSFERRRRMLSEAAPPHAKPT